MLKSIKAVSFAVGGILLFSTMVVAEEKPRLAVLNFATRGSVEEADAIAEELRGAFVKSGKYTVVDRTQTEQILKEWETQQSGLTDDQKAIKIGKLHNVKLIVTGKLNKFASGGWQVSAVMLDAQTGVTLKSERVRHRGDFFTLLDQKVTGLAMVLAGLESPSKADQHRQPTQQAAIRAEPSSTYHYPVTGMEFVWVPGGTFEMGCHSGNDGECEDNEKPVRNVRLDGFWIGKYEVTQGQWKRVMGFNPSMFKKGDNYPVERVSWNDVQEFIRKLNARSSAKFRLPSEAQWEYACRAGGKPIKFGTGNGQVSTGNANYKLNNGGTTPVGKYQANALGLHDMSGNVWEWVHDKYTENYEIVGTSNPINEGSGDDRVLRGGSWRSVSRYLRCSYRYDYGPSRRRNRLSFRLLRTR